MLGLKIDNKIMTPASKWYLRNLRSLSLELIDFTLPYDIFILSKNFYVDKGFVVGNHQFFA